jgi:hypothetical protein
MGRYDKYFNITVKREIYVELKKLAETHGLSVPDFLALIVKTYNLVETLNKTINLLGSSQYITGKIPVSEDSSSTSPVAKPTRNTSNNTITTNTGNNPPQQPSPKAERGQKKGDACSWLEEKKIIVEGDIADRYDRNTRDRLFRKWKEMCKAEVVEGSSERAAVIPQLWGELQKKINMINSDSDELAKKMLGKDEYRLFRWLRDQGVLIFSNIEKRWKIVK